MKKLLALLPILLLIISCSNGQFGYEPTKNTNRIKLIDDANEYYTLLSVDSHEYLSNHNGGIVHIITCKKCLTNKSK